MNKRGAALAAWLVATTGLASFPSVAFAQEGRSVENGPSSGEIIVTARKREETALDVPVALTALSGSDLQRYAASDFSSIANQVPGLIVQTIPGGAGGSVALRGVTSSNSNPAIDQAVALNVDGVQLGSASYLRLSQIDLQQIEVLKGPQALFFGKNSPGGVISIRTADPRDIFEASVKLGYEFNAREATAEAMVSGPLSDTLRARLVVYGTTMDGYFKNHAQVYPGFTFEAPENRAPKGHEIYARGTLLFDPTDNFSVRLKYGYSKRDFDTSPSYVQQRIYCPGPPQLNGYPGTVDCKADGRITSGGFDPRALAVHPRPADEGSATEQHVGSLEANYELAPGVTFTSVTGFFKINDSFMGANNYQSGTPLIAGTYMMRREISQEVRLSTDKADWPVNFTVGGFFQDLDFKQHLPYTADLFALKLAAAPGLGYSTVDNHFAMSGKTYSAFISAIVPLGERFELAGGVRYSKEEKSIRVRTKTGPITPLDDKVEYKNWSPEATITFRPTNNLTFFGAWRNGFKSGGFNTGGGSYANNQKIDYRPEDAAGFEVGMKFADGPLRFNLTAYTYKYSDMQVSTFDPATITQTVVNAASARIKGLEADINYRTPVDGLSLRGAANYNHARYIDFFVGCYVGQTIAQGCNLTPNAVTGAFQQQDFRGKQLLLAPDWTGNVGFTFEQPVGSSLKVTLTGDANFSSSFYGQLEEAEFVKQRSYTMFDASIRVGDVDDRWEVALMGRNLNKIYRSRFVSQTPFTGINARTGTALEGGLADYSGQVNRGREVRLQISYKFR